MDEHRQAPEQRSAQRSLARELTALVHGEAVAKMPNRRRAISPDPPRSARAEELAALVERSHHRVQRARVAGGLDIVDLLVETGLATVEGRRVPSHRTAGDLRQRCPARRRPRSSRSTALLHDRFAMLRRGKKRRHLVVVEP